MRCNATALPLALAPLLLPQHFSLPPLSLSLLLVGTATPHTRSRPRTSGRATTPPSPSRARCCSRAWRRRSARRLPRACGARRSASRRRSSSTSCCSASQSRRRAGELVYMRVRVIERPIGREVRANGRPYTSVCLFVARAARASKRQLQSNKRAPTTTTTPTTTTPPNAGRFVANRFLRKRNLPAHQVEQAVEWLYSFDVHCNSYFVLLLELYGEAEGGGAAGGWIAGDGRAAKGRGRATGDARGRAVCFCF